MNGIASLSDEDISRIVKSAHEMLDQYNLCDSCLGRQFAFLGRNITNSERGRALKLYLTLVASELVEEGRKTEGIALLKIVATHGNFSGAVATLKKLGINIDPVQACYICEGFMEKIKTFAELITKKLNDWEYRTFLIGSRIPEIVIDREDVLRAKFNIKYGESIKAELNREIGKRITGLEKEVNFESPDILAVINPITQDIEMHINPLFIFGRYRKLKRGISQTRWICWNCEGRGCDECEGKGLRYEHSVEAFIAEPILKVAEGVEYKFHGAGREDIDARMLGTGRPFVVEIKEPKKRFIDLKWIQEKINELAQGNVEVLDLQYSDRATIRNIKALAQITEKTYRIIVETKDPVTLETIKHADEVLSGAVIQQRTPKRVVHRRADKLRIKKVYEFKTTPIGETKLEIIVRCQGGCYVKELCTGDDGRTQPNLSDLLKTQVSVIELDVLHVA